MQEKMPAGEDSSKAMSHELQALTNYRDRASKRDSASCSSCVTVLRVPPVRCIAGGLQWRFGEWFYCWAQALCGPTGVHERAVLETRVI